MTTDYIIGYSNRLPWKLSVDLKRFRRLTTPHSVIMGRKTFESIGRPLPRRQNIVVTRKKKFHPKGCLTANSLPAAICKVNRDSKVFVIGGGELYREALPISERIYLTLIEIDPDHKQSFLFEPFSGDAHFPSISGSEWRLVRPAVRRLALPLGPKNVDTDSVLKKVRPIYFRFLTLVRRKRNLNTNTPSNISQSGFDLSWLKNAKDRTRSIKRSLPTKKTVRARYQDDLFE